MGIFIPTGMRTKITATGALIINTCSDNDTGSAGTTTSWSWCNPTNQAVAHPYHDVVAISVETLWQGTKLLAGQDKPDPTILLGNWRKHKGKRPVGAYAGPGQPLITSPGEARRQIYLPAYARLIEHWLQDPRVAGWVQAARDHPGSTYLRDHDTGQGVDRNGPMSHGWLLSVFLNTGKWPA